MNKYYCCILQYSKPLFLKLYLSSSIHSQPFKSLLVEQKLALLSQRDSFCSFSKLLGHSELCKLGGVPSHQAITPKHQIFIYTLVTRRSEKHHVDLGGNNPGSQSLGFSLLSALAVHHVICLLVLKTTRTLVGKLRS